MTGRTSCNCREVFMVPLSVNFRYHYQLWPTSLLHLQIPEFPSNLDVSMQIKSYNDIALAHESYKYVNFR